MKKRFTISALLVFTAVVACILSAIPWYKSRFATDVSSEVFLVNGTPYSPRWLECKPFDVEPGVTDNCHPEGTSFTGYIENEIYQNLFTATYADGFGNNAFEFSCDLDAVFDNSWMRRSFDATANGGGNEDTSAFVEMRIDPGNRVVIVGIWMKIGDPTIYRKCVLPFVWDGKRFVVQSAG